MASLPGNGTGTLSVKHRPPDGMTTNLPDQTGEGEGDDRPVSESRDRTVARINRQERGDRRIKDLYAPADGTSSATGDEEVAASTRKETAGQLAKAIRRVIAAYGSASMATAFQLLRRELSKCHDSLGPLPSESNFLSITTLVEMELGNKSWQQVSQEELNALKRAIDLGVSEPRVTYDHFNQTCRVLNASGYVTGPALEFPEPFEPPDEGPESPPDE
jgi:hypothetical protein